MLVPLHAYCLLHAWHSFCDELILLYAIYLSDLNQAVLNKVS